MKHYIIQESKRAFLSSQALITYFLCILLFFIGFYQYIPHIANGDVSIFDNFLAGYNSGTLSYLSLLFPIIACIPFSTSLFEDSSSGFNKYIYTRMKKKIYYTIRLLMNALVGGFSVIIGPVIGFTFLSAFNLFSNVEYIKKTDSSETLLYFHQLGITSPFLMIGIIIAILFFAGASIATFSLGLSTLLNNPYFTALSSFVFLLISALLLSKINIKLSMFSLYEINHYGMTFFERFLYEFILIAFGVLLVYLNNRKLDDRYV